MEHIVLGVDKRTGKDVKRRYPSRTEEAARILAHEDGIMVERVEAVSEPAPPPAASPARPTSPLEDLATVAAVSYRQPSTPKASAEVPDYLGLRIAARILTVYAYILYAIGAILLAVTIYITVQDLRQNFGIYRDSPWLLSTLVLATFIPSVATLVTGGLAHGIGAACVAVRDMARNSWKMANRIDG